LHGIEPGELRRQHADDRHRHAGDPHGAVDHIRVSTELALPIAVAQHDDGMRARRHVIVAVQQAAEEWLDPKDLEVAAAHQLADGGRTAALGADRDTLAPRGATQHTLEHVRRRGQFATERVVESRLVSQFRVAARQHDQPPGFVHGQFGKQQPVDEAEHRGVPADAEGEGGNRHRRECGTPAELADRVAKVPPALVEPRAMPAASNALLHLLHAAEQQHRAAPGFDRGLAVAHPIGRGHRDERLQLVVELPLGAGPAKEPAHSRLETMQDLRDRLL
jgi:hypothetical protein